MEKNLQKTRRYFRAKIFAERTKLLMPLLFAVFTFQAYSQAGPVIDLQKKYIDNDSDYIEAWAETSDGYLIAGHTFSQLGLDSSYDYGLLKFRSKPIIPSPFVHLEVSHDNYSDSFTTTALPFYLGASVSKVTFYEDGVKISEDTNSPYQSNWEGTGVGDHQFKAVAYSSEGQQISSQVIKAKVFNYFGIQAESGHYTIADIGKFPVKEEIYPTLNAGSSIRLWDVGDRERFYLNLSAGSYVIKVHLRSGAYNSTYSNPKSYWPDGYSFWVNDVPTKFTGDLNSISAKNEAYGGSYWGTMVSPVVVFTENNHQRLEIQANKKWGGVDYIEVIPKSTDRIEAEASYTPLNDVGPKVIGEEMYHTLSAGSSTKIWDVGDKVQIRFFSLPGSYIITARVRIGYYTPSSTKPTNYWPDGYKFWLNDQLITFTGEYKTVTKDPAYGGSYWGTMKTDVLSLTRGWKTIDVQANIQWCGIDYLELVPVEANSARLVLAETRKTGKIDVHPNPFKTSVNVELPESNDWVTITLIDALGNVQMNERIQLYNQNTFSLDFSSLSLRAGLYLLKVEGEAGEKMVRITKE